MKQPSPSRPLATGNLDSPRSCRFAPWLALGLVAVLGLSVSAQAQLNVVNGHFGSPVGTRPGEDVHRSNAGRNTR